MAADMTLQRAKPPRAGPWSLVLAAVLLWGCVPTAPPPPAATLPPPQTAAGPIPAKRIDAAIDQLGGLAVTMLADTGIPGLAVAVVWQGRTVYAKGFGVHVVFATGFCAMVYVNGFRQQGVA
jgi:CubicO group peptidase (beta-lactamase class C family)